MIDNILIIAGFRSFNSTDGETAYFSGQNPRIMSFIEQHIYIVAIFTVNDSSGKEFKYKMIDKVDVYDLDNGRLKALVNQQSMLIIMELEEHLF